MTYGTSHLLIGGGVEGIFRGEGQENTLLCKAGRGGHYMKNKNMGWGCFVNST